MTFITEAISAIVLAMTDLVTALASNSVNFFNGFFLVYDETTLEYSVSNIGLMAMAFIGIALALGITKWISSFARVGGGISRGRRRRRRR